MDEPDYTTVVERLRDIGLLDDPATLDETVELFLADAATAIGQLKDAFTSGDSDALESASHRLKGAALNLGVSTIAQPAKAIEEEAHRSHFSGAPGAIGELELELPRVAEFLRGQVVKARAG
jgi:HPt (histidine-containing phosphotransfer) domain-containing protein